MNAAGYLNKRSATYVIVTVFMIAISLMFWLVSVQAAGTASLTLSSSSNSFSSDSNFSLSIYEKSDTEQVNAVEANLSYDASKLEFVSLSTTGSPFTSCTQKTGGGGSVIISCAKLGGSTTGSQKVASVVFKPLASSGATNVTFRTDSKILRSADSSDIWNKAITGGTYNLTTPVAQNAGSTGHSSAAVTSLSSGYASSASASQQADPTAPVSTTDTPQAIDGYLVAIKVVDESGHSVSGANVSLSGQTATSDASGVARFVNIPVGSHQITAKTEHGTVLSSVDIAGDALPGSVQGLTVKLDSNDFNPYIIIIPTLLAGLVALAFAWRTGYLSQFSNKIISSRSDSAAYVSEITAESNSDSTRSLSRRLSHLSQPEIPKPSDVIKPSLHR